MVRDYAGEPDSGNRVETHLSFQVLVVFRNKFTSILKKDFLAEPGYGK